MKKYYLVEMVPTDDGIKSVIHSQDECTPFAIHPKAMCATVALTLKQAKVVAESYEKHPRAHCMFIPEYPYEILEGGNHHE